MRGVKYRIAWVAEKCKGKDVLDIGSCGAIDTFTDAQILNKDWLEKHWLFEAIAKRAKSVMGIDVSKTGIERARRFGYNNIIFGNAENFNLDRQYETVSACEVIEHLSNLGLFLSCIKKHLRPGGELLLTTQNALHIYTFLDAKANPDHVQLYNMAVLKRLLAVNGFRVLVEEYLDINPASIMGKLYVKLFSRLYPKFLLNLGVVAKATESSEIRNELDERV